MNALNHGDNAIGQRHQRHNLNGVEASQPSINTKLLDEMGGFRVYNPNQGVLKGRKVYQEVPPKVEYSLTELRGTLESLLVALKRWGETYAPHYVQAVPDDSASNDF